MPLTEAPRQRRAASGSRHACREGPSPGCEQPGPHVKPQGVQAAAGQVPAHSLEEDVPGPVQPQKSSGEPLPGLGRPQPTGTQKPPLVPPLPRGLRRRLPSCRQPRLCPGAHSACGWRTAVWTAGSGAAPVGTRRFSPGPGPADEPRKGKAVASSASWGACPSLSREGGPVSAGSCP